MLADTILPRLCMKQADLLEDFFSPSWQSKFSEPSWISEIIQFFASHTDLLNRAQRTLWLRAEVNDSFDENAVKDILSGLIESALARGHMLQNVVAQNRPSRPGQSEGNGAGASATHPEKAGIQILGAEELDKSVRVLTNLLEAHQKSWPREKPPTKEETIAAYERGECADAEDAFAEIAGMNREEWLQRVEEHKHRKCAARGT